MSFAGYRLYLLRDALFLSVIGIWAISCLTGCAVSPSPQRGGAASIGKAILAPLNAIGSFARPDTDQAVENTGKAKETPPVSLPEDTLASIAQPDNPGQSSQQNIEVERTEEITFAKDTVQIAPDGTKTEIPAGSKQTVREARKAGQLIGASQRDTSKSDAAWLASFQKVQALGVIVFLAGIVGFAWAPARALVGKDTAVVIGCAGLVLIFGPAILQKYGHYFVGVLILAALYWFFSRSKLKEGRLSVLEEQQKPPPQ